MTAKPLLGFALGVYLIFIGTQVVIAGLFKPKPLDQEARGVLEKIEWGVYQYPGYIIVNPDEIYSYQFNQGKIQVTRVQALPEYLEMPDLWEAEDE